MDEDNAVKQPIKQHHNKGKAWGKPFQKGKTGNKKGRPVKELSITQALRDYMHEIPQITVGGSKNTDKTWAQLVALGMLLKSVKGDASMAREIIDRLEGKVAQPVTGEGGVPLAFNLIVQSSDVKAALEEAKKRLT